MSHQFKKFQEIREKSKEQKVFFETKQYESMISEEIKIFNKTTDEAMVERMIQGERIDTFKITEETSKSLKKRKLINKRLNLKF